jgi:hypothetical protein
LPLDMKLTTNKKAPAPIARPRARFYYDDLFSYLLRMAQLLQCGACLRLYPSKVTFLVAGFEHLPVLYNYAQAPREMEPTQ